jgi:hypothetical protein
MKAENVGTVEPGETAVARHQLGEHVSTETNQEAIIELLEAMFSIRYVLRLYNEDQWDKPETLCIV